MYFYLELWSKVKIDLLIGERQKHSTLMGKMEYKMGQLKRLLEENLKKLRGERILRIDD